MLREQSADKLSVFVFVSCSSIARILNYFYAFFIFLCLNTPPCASIPRLPPALAFRRRGFACVRGNKAHRRLAEDGSWELAGAPDEASDRTSARDGGPDDGLVAGDGVRDEGCDTEHAAGVACRVRGLHTLALLSVEVSEKPALVQAAQHLETSHAMSS